MRYYRFPDTKLWKALFVLFLLLELFLTRSGMSGTLAGFLTSQMLMIGGIVLAGLAFLWQNRQGWKDIFRDSRFLTAAVFAVVMLLPMLCKRDWQLMYVTILMGLLLAVFLSYFVTLQQTAKYYVLMLCALSVYAIMATYLFRRLPDGGILEVPRFINAAGNEYYNFGFAYVSITHVASRNLGIFREPGVYQFFLLVALYLCNYIVSWKKEWHMWAATAILAVTLLTTMATGGVIALGLYVVIVFFEKKLYRNQYMRLLAVIAVVAALVVVAVSFVKQNAIYWFIYDTLLEKFINRTDSVTERVDGIIWNLTLFFQNPVFGAKLADVLHGVNNNTSSTLIVFAAYGIIGALLHLAGWIALVWRKDRNVIWNLGLLAVLFMGFNTQNLTWDLYFWLFPTMALLEWGLPLLNSRLAGHKRK